MGNPDSFLLHRAASAEDMDALEELIQGGANVDAMDDAGLTPYDHAVRDDKDAAQALLRRLGGHSGEELRRPNAAKAEVDKLSFLKRADVNHVVARLPESARQRLRDVFFSANSSGVRWLGWTTTRGRRDVTLCSILPVRMSLARFLHRRQPPSAFGAERGSQWTPWAIRRFLLYDVLLHEIGHLRVIDPSSSNPKRRFASETLAQEFADMWRQRLWAEHDDHPDPVHNPPAEDERAFLEAWARMGKWERFDLAFLVVNAPHRGPLHLRARFGELAAEDEAFLERALRLQPV